jgi:uncharacterized protein YndB with AHSA1/START domain
MCNHVVVMPTVTREVTLPVEPEEAWADVSEAERLAEWMDEEVELDLWEGGDVRIGDRSGTVHEVDEDGRRLSFSLGDSGITFTVEPAVEGSRVRVTETGPVMSFAPRLHALALCPA